MRRRDTQSNSCEQLASARTLYSPQMTIDAPGHTYETTFKLSTKNLIPIDGGPSSGAATLTEMYTYIFSMSTEILGRGTLNSVRWPSRMLRIFSSPRILRHLRLRQRFKFISRLQHIHSRRSPNRMLGGQEKGEARMSSSNQGSWKDCERSERNNIHGGRRNDSKCCRPSF